MADTIKISPSLTHFQSSQVDKLSGFTWTIEHFSEATENITLPLVWDDKEENQFEITFSLDSGGVYLSLSIVSKYLKYFDTDNAFKYRVSVVDFSGGKRFCKEGTGLMYRGRRGHKWINVNNFILRNALFENANKYLPDDKLTLFVEIGQTEYHSSISNPMDFWFSKTTPAPLEDFSSLLQGEEIADVTLVVDGHEFTIHKSVLCARSKVFAAMFAHETKEKAENRIIIEDIKVKIFEKLHEYLYSGRAPLVNSSCAEEWLTVAEQYQLEHLKLACEESLSLQLTIENVGSLFQLAHALNASKLMDAIWHFLSTHGCQFFQAMRSQPDQLADMFRYLALKSDQETNDEDEEKK